ncbi:MAG: hypothetical protein F6K55_03425 [Moorea sp. SIO4A3]|nr:hypothetical protein [Moorena sp. SIO4A3]
MARYIIGSQSEGQVKIQGLAGVVFDTSSVIGLRTGTGALTYNPDSGNVERIPGRPELDTLTLGGLFSPSQFLKVYNLYKDPLSKTGDLSGIHIANQIETYLKGLKFMELTWGEFDKTSNDPIRMSLVISFSDTDAKLKT